MRSLSSRSRAAVAVLSGLTCAILLQCLLPPAAQAQDIPGRRLNDIYINARFHDGYWEWYHQYLQEREEIRAEITEIRMMIAVLAAERKKLRAEWLKYLYLENQLVPKSAYDQGWMAYFGEIAGESRREVDRIAFKYTAGLWGAPLVAEETDVSVERGYQQRRDELRAQINSLKDDQGRLIDEAWGFHRILEQLCHEQKQKSGERRPWLNAEVRRLEDQLIMLEVQLYDAAQWYLPNELPALVDRLDLDNTATEEVALFLRAKVALATAAWNDEKNWLQLTSPRQAPPTPEWVMAARAPRLEALVNLRRVIELNPEHAEARGMVMEQELYWLREIAAKVDLENRATAKAFGEYLKARGFYVDQPQGWSQHAYEVISALWGLGPIALTAALPGLNVADARATELDVTQTAVARNQVSLLAIMRLVKNGVPLTEIPGMSSDQVAELMTMHTADGRPLPDDKARQVAGDMHATFSELDDLRLLASADPEYLVEDVNKAYGKTYYAPLDPTYTWYESFGDLMNVHNLALLWGPGAVAKIDGKWAGVRHIAGSEIRALEQAERLVTGRQLFLSVTKLDRLGQMFASTSLGSRFVAALERDRALMTGQGAIMTLANLGARLSSAMILYGGTTYLGNQAGIPGMGLLVEVVGEIGPAQMLSDVAAHAHVPMDELGTRIDEFGEFLIREQDELTTSRQYLDEVADLGEELSDDAIDGSRRAAIEQRLDEIVEEVEEKAADRLPGSLSEPVDEATKSAARSLKNGDDLEAESALAGGAEIAEQTGTKLDEVVDEATAAGAKAANGGQAPPLQPISMDRLKTIRQLYGEGVPESFWRSDLYNSGGEVGRCLQLGDEAIRRGDLDAAKGHFEAAERLLREDSYPIALRDHREFARDRFDLVSHALRLQEDVDVWRRLVRPNNATLDIAEDTADEVLRKFDAGETQAVGSANDVVLVYDDAGNGYYVKQMPADRVDPAQAQEILAAEAASCGLAQKVDDLERAAADAGPEYASLTAPAARFDPDRGLLITRAIPNAEELAGMPEFISLAFKREYAKQRLFRAWLGDTDGHLRNILIGEDGRVYMIDFDMAILTGAYNRQLTHDLMATPGEMVERTVKVWTEADRKGRVNPMYDWMTRLDQTINYDEVRPTIEAIQELARDRDGLVRFLGEVGYPNPESAADNLIARANELDEVARELFDGGLLTQATSDLQSVSDDWLADLPASIPPVPLAAAAIQVPSMWFGGVAAVISRPAELRRAA